ncbi:zinc-ribbon domain-containing protein [Priestia megaterium]
MDSLAYFYPEIAVGWHPTRNGMIKPTGVSPKSSKKCFFRCFKGHYYLSTVSNRHRNGCPFCYNRSHNNNCIAKLSPQVAIEWDPIKNDEKTPLDYTRGNGKKAYFICTNNHSTHSNIRVRMRTVSLGCTECSKESRSSFVEQAVYYYMKKVFTDTENKYMHPLLKENNSEIDVYSMRINLGIEINGNYFHVRRNRKQSDENKSRLLSKDRELILLLVKELPRENIQCLEEISGTPSLYYKEGDISSINRMIKNIFTYIEESASINDHDSRTINNLDIDIVKDEIAIYESYIRMKKVKNLKTLRPELAKQWHPTRNGTLKPEFFHAHSSKKVWFKCPNGHFRKSLINKKSNCVYCVGQRACMDNNLSYIYPDIAYTFHPTRNEQKSPLSHTGSSGDEIFWSCSRGHHFLSIIYNRTNDYNCPYCAIGNRVDRETSLAYADPLLALDWHPTRNLNVTPLDKGQFSHKKVYWKCWERGHFYKSMIMNRTKGATCSGCSNRIFTIDNNLSFKEPYIAFAWHLTRNNSATPCQYGIASHFNAIWKCEEGCNFQSSITNRVNNYKCSYCSGKKVNSKNNLAYKIPSLALEINFDKNEYLTPLDFTSGSNKRFYFKNKLSSINSKVKNYYRKDKVL